MTTTTPNAGQAPRISGSRVLVGAAVGALLVGVVVVTVAALLAGSDAASAAVVGAVITAAVFLVGALVVNLVASLLPTASLLVALLTYTLQVVVLAIAFAALSDSALMAESEARTWLAVAVITTTAAWLVAQIWLTTRMRIPVYELPAEGSPQGRTGGER